MARYIKYTFPGADTQGVSLTQTLGGAGNLVLNGHLADSINSQVSFSAQGYSRAVSITSANNLAAATFTVTGTQNGVIVTENINGINNNTVDGTTIFDIVTSISVNAAVVGVSVGSGITGSFTLIDIDLNVGSLNYSLTLASSTGANQIPTVIHGTNDKIRLNGATYTANIANNHALIQIKAAAAATQFVFPIPVAANLAVYMPLYTSLLIELNGTNATRASGMTLIFIQI